jgi:hypothetical protein
VNSIYGFIWYGRGKRLSVQFFDFYFFEENPLHVLVLNVKYDYKCSPAIQVTWDYEGHEVDFIIGDEIAIEVKSTELVTEKHLKNLKMFSDDVKIKHKIVVSLDPSPRKLGDISVIPWREFLSRLWSGDFAG